MKKYHGTFSKFILGALNLRGNPKSAKVQGESIEGVESIRL